MLGIIALGIVWSVAGTAVAYSKQAPTDNSAKYSWQPVRIGAGGWVVGFVPHPTVATVRYARTDVGNGYRWDSTTSQWQPMKVLNADGTGFPANIITAAGPGGVHAIGVDPNNAKVVYVAAPNFHSGDVGGGTNINIYKSVDGGVTFKAGNLNVPGDPNDNFRYLGERIRVDPQNSKVVYYGTGFGSYSTTGSGLYRSVDAGVTWTQVNPTGAFSTTDNIINIVIDKSAGLTTTTPLGTTVGKVSKLVWARGGHNVNGNFSSDRYQSKDGGVTWTNASKGTGLAGKVGQIFVNPSGTLYVLQNNSNQLWTLSGTTWTSYNVGTGLVNLTFDPKNPNRIFGIAGDASTLRSLDGGKTWVNFGRLKYANTLAWLPQVPGDAQAYGYRSTGGIYIDPAGTLWVCQGNEGMLHYTPSATNTETANNPPKWVIDSKGIEELVAQSILVPKGGADKIYTAVEDATGMVVPNPDTYSATQIPLQTNLISQGTQVAFVPGDPNTVAVSTSNVYNNGANESGITYDGGKTWTKFGTNIKYTNQWGTFDMQSGSIAISKRGTWKAGADHMVHLPVYSFTPLYSKDSGKTWKKTLSFPLASDGLSLDGSKGYQGFWIFALKQQLLQADPFVADKFYLKFVNAPAGLYVSTDGGVTWSGLSNNGLPGYTHHGQLAVNYNVQNDLWFVDGWEGATDHGVFHSKDGGKTFTKISGISNAITLAIGAGSGVKGDAPYSIYFYGKFANDPKWGVFQSTNGGTSWNRVSFFPAGIYDQPTSMAASYDTFGKVYVGFSGNSYVYGKLKGTKAP